MSDHTTHEGERMECFCCRQPTDLARKVKVRPWVELDEDRPPPPPDSAAYAHYVEQTTYRWAVVCQPCYTALDSSSHGGAFLGGAFGGGEPFTMAAQSRGDKAIVMDRAKYERWQAAEARKLGL